MTSSMWRAFADVLGGLVIGFGLVAALFVLGPGYIIAPLILVLIGVQQILVAELVWRGRQVDRLKRPASHDEGCQPLCAAARAAIEEDRFP